MALNFVFKVQLKPQIEQNIHLKPKIKHKITQDCTTFTILLILESHNDLLCSLKLYQMN